MGVTFPTRISPLPNRGGVGDPKPSESDESGRPMLSEDDWAARGVKGGANGGTKSTGEGDEVNSSGDDDDWEPVVTKRRGGGRCPRARRRSRVRDALRVDSSMDEDEGLGGEGEDEDDFASPHLSAGSVVMARRPGQGGGSEKSLINY